MHMFYKNMQFIAFEQSKNDLHVHDIIIYDLNGFGGVALTLYMAGSRK